MKKKHTWTDYILPSLGRGLGKGLLFSSLAPSLALFLLLALPTSCRKEQVIQSPEETARIDSLALHVGVMPVMDCLPFFYAQRMGIFDAEGVDVRLHLYGAQMDADTALLSRRMEIVYTDLAHALEMQGDSLPVRVVAGMRGKLSLLTTKKKRIRALKHLDERMIALNRLSESDYWSDEIMRQAGLERTAIYRPQINDVQLRWTMLHDQLVDGAILPEPYVTQAKLEGHNCIFTPSDSATAWACLAIRKETVTDAHRNQQLKALLKAYNKAAEALNGKAYPADTLSAIWARVYKLPREVADSVSLPQFPKATLPQAKDADLAMRWLIQRERRIRKAQRDSLFLSLF